MGIPFKTRNQICKVVFQLSALVYICGGSGNAFAQTLDFKASISNNSPAVGEEVTVTLEVGSPDNLYSVAFDMCYSQSLFAFLDCTEGIVLKSGGYSTTFLTSVNETSGKVIVAISRLNPDPTVTYTGYQPCAIFRFRAINGGNYTFSTSNVGFMDNSANSLSFTQTSIPITGTIGTGNNPPVISPDLPATLSLNEDTPAQFDLLVYFSDVEDDQNSIPIVAEVDQSTINNSIIQAATFSGHILNITPMVNASGSDVITIIIADSYGDHVSRAITVSVAPVNDLPAITSQRSITIDEESSYTIVLSDLTVTDPDNTWPGDFTLAVGVGGHYSKSGNTITPEVDFNGELDVPVTVNDGGGTSDPFSVTVSVTPVNDRPIITGQRSITIDEESSCTIVLSDLTVADPDNTWPADFILSVADGDHYSVSGNTIAPVADFNGVLHVPVTVNDGTIVSESYSMTFTVGAVNDPPVIENCTPDADTVRIKTGTTVSFSATITDKDDTPSVEWTHNGVSTGQAIEFDSAGTDSVVVTASDGVNISRRIWFVIVEAFGTDEAVPVALNENCDVLVEYTDGTRFFFHLNSESCSGDTVIFNYTGQSTSPLLPGVEGIFFSIDGNFSEPFDARITVSKPSITDEMAISYYDGTAWNLPDTFETTVPHAKSSKLMAFGQCAVVDKSVFDVSTRKLRRSSLPGKYSLSALNRGGVLLQVPLAIHANRHGVLSVTDMRGRSVETVTLNNLQPGIHQICLKNCTANAMYLIQFISAEFNAVIKYCHLQ